MPVINQVKICSAADNPTELSGRIESVGTYFEIKDSEYLNVTLQSSEEIKVVLESIPRMISLDADNFDNDVNFSDLTLSGLEPNKTYYKYEDSHKNPIVFVADENGTHSWNQDLTQYHHIWIQETKSTIYLPEDCGVYGSWNEITATCTLDKALIGTVEITKNDIILDCNKHSISGPGFKYGLYLYDRSGVVVTNCNINNFSRGIALFYSNNNELVNNNVSGNWTGIHIHDSTDNILSNNIVSSNGSSGICNFRSSNNTFTGNIISNNPYVGISNSYSSNDTFIENVIYDNRCGIDHRYSSNNTFTGNIISDNLWNFYIFGSDISHYTHHVDISNLVGGKPFYYLLGARNQIFDSSTNIGLFYCIGCNEITIKDLTFDKDGYSILFYDTHNSRVENVTVSDSYRGINLEYSTGNTIINNTLNGISSISNEHSMSYGIRLLEHSDNNIIADNTFFNNYCGVNFRNSFDNKIYHNNFVNNFRQAVIGGTINDFDNGYPDGGNYWDNYDEVLEGCIDADDDGICDAPYVFKYGIGQDNYPSTTENGWEEPSPNTVPLYTQVISPYPSEDETDSWDHLPYAQGLNYGCGSTIADCGCAITSMIMIGRFYNIDNDIDNSNADPKNINDWLNDNYGYAGGSLYWNKAVEYLGYIDEITGKKMAKLSFDYYNEPFSSSQIDNYISNEKPIVAYSNVFGHYFVIDGKSSDIYTVKDPYWYNTKTLDDSKNIANHIQDYNNYFTKANLFSYLETPKKIAASMHIYLASPAELIITDPNGKKLGRDPIGDIIYNDILNSNYTIEGAIISSDDSPGKIHEKKVIYIPNPVDGLYDIQVIGTGDGDYTLTFFIYDNEGESREIVQEGSIVQNDIQEFELNYLTEDVQQIETYQSVNIDIKPGSEQNSINLESKGVIPVAVLSNQFFDVQEIDIESILFAEASPPKWKIEDVDDDGDLDLMLHFETQFLDLSPTDTGAILIGKLNDKTPIKGTDSIEIVGKNKNK